MKLNTFSQFTSNAARFHEIVNVFVKYGLANWVHEKDPAFVKGFFKTSKGVNFAGESLPVRLRMALTELGTTFIKLGQILSTRTDLVGPEIAHELSRLQSDTPADSRDQVTRTLESELGKPLEECFAKFDFNPLGSASIGQVHKARLSDGRTVVVKIQHHDIENKIISDLEILASLARLAEKYDSELRLYQPQAMVAEFSRTLLKELDYLRELRNMELFVRNFADNENVHIPAGYGEYSSKRVLTMEMLDGFSIADTEKLQAADYDTKELARTGANMYLDMVFRDRFFHADPHPGNILVLSGGRIGLLDSGMITRLDEALHDELEAIVLALADHDPTELTDRVIRICTLPNGFDRSALRVDIDDFLSEYVNQSLKNLDLAEALNNLTAIIRRHYLILPTGISMLIRVLIMLEGTSRLLDRDFSLSDLIDPYTHKMIARRLAPKKLFSRMRKSYKEWDRLLTMLPRDLVDILNRMREGRFDIHLEHRRLDAVVNRMVYGILSGAVFLGGCMVLSSGIPPLIRGVSVIGGVIIFLGCFLAFRLHQAVARSGNLVKDDEL
ncbi:MAG: AarF/ABC1/UbiB kinase family protein [Thermodesulfobacteriota bacterium]